MVNPFLKFQDVPDYTKTKTDISFGLIEKLSKKAKETKIKALIALEKIDIQKEDLSLFVCNILPLIEQQDFIIQNHSRKLFDIQLRKHHVHMIDVLEEQRFDWLNYVVRNNIADSRIATIIIDRAGSIGKLEILFHVIKHLYKHNEIGKALSIDFDAIFKENINLELLYKTLVAIDMIEKKNAFHASDSNILLPSSSGNKQENLLSVLSEFKQKAYDFLKTKVEPQFWSRHFILLSVYGYICIEEFVSDLKYYSDEKFGRMLHLLDGEKQESFLQHFISRLKSKNNEAFSDQKVDTVFDKLLLTDEEKKKFIVENIERFGFLFKKIFFLTEEKRKETFEIVFRILGEKRFNECLAKYLIDCQEVQNIDIFNFLAPEMLNSHNLVNIVFRLRKSLTPYEIFSLLKSLSISDFYHNWSCVSQIFSLSGILDYFIQRDINFFENIKSKLDFTFFFERFNEQLLNPLFQSVKYDVSRVLASIDDCCIIYELLSQIDSSDIPGLLEEIKSRFMPGKEHHLLLSVFLLLHYQTDLNFPFTYKILYDLQGNTELFTFLLTNDSSNFFKFIEEYICCLDIYNRFNALYVGYNLDTPVFDMEYQMPFFDETCSLLCSVLYQHRFVIHDPKGILLMNVLRFINYEDLVFENNKLYESSRTVAINFGENNFLCERVKKETEKLKIIEFDRKKIIDVKFSNKFKYLDLLIRKGVLECVGVVDPTFLSFQALEKVVDLIIANDKTKASAVIPDLHGNMRSIRSLLKTYRTPVEALEMMETDSNLCFSFLRSKRLKIYNRLLKASIPFCTTSMLETYNYSMLEQVNNENSIFLFVTDIFVPYRRNYFYILSFMTNQLASISIALFVEKISMIKCMNDPLFAERLETFCYNSLILGKNDYSEARIFALAFPNFYRNLIREKNNNYNFFLNIIDDMHIQEFTSKTYEYLFSVTSMKSSDRYTLRYSYQADSSKSVLEFIIPFDIRKPGYINNLDASGKRKKKIGKELLLMKELATKTTKYHMIFLNWKTDIDIALAEYSECPICYFIIDPIHNSYPDYSCSNCTMKFHSNCLFKWVSSSKDKECPLCRGKMEFSN